MLWTGPPLFCAAPAHNVMIYAARLVTRTGSVPGPRTLSAGLGRGAAAGAWRAGCR